MILVSLEELKTNIVDNIISIGVDSKIKECTFLDSIIEEINEVFTTEDFKKIDKYINCISDKDTISFNIKNDGIRNEVVIKVLNKSEFLINISTIGEKTIKIYEKVVNLNNRTITTNQAICKYKDIEEEQNNTSMVIEKVYDEDGIMTDYIVIRFKPNSIVSGINQNYKDVILHIPHNYKESDFWKNNYFSKIVLSRLYLDVASLKIDYKESGMFYSSSVKLETSIGLRDMILPNEVRVSLPKDYIIEPLPEDEIENLLFSNEEKHRNGLKKYIKDRSSYYYNSKSDPNFKHEIRR